MASRLIRSLSRRRSLVAAVVLLLLLSISGSACSPFAARPAEPALGKLEEAWALLRADQRRASAISQRCIRNAGGDGISCLRVSTSRYADALRKFVERVERIEMPADATRATERLLESADKRAAVYEQMAEAVDLVAFQQLQPQLDGANAKAFGENFAELTIILIM